MKRQSAFTLVELAIVMTVIGLLIGGVLKGQELIQNARIKKTISQIKSYTVAYTTFTDVHGGAIPGDFRHARTRLPGCTAAAVCRNGNGNGIIGVVYYSWYSATNASMSSENLQFWKHLFFANLVTGIQGNAATPEWGETHPAAPLFTGGFHAKSTEPNNTGTDAGLFRMAGPVMVWRENIGGNHTTSIGTNYATVSPYVASIIDRKMDDGAAVSGSVQARGAANDYCGRPNTSGNNDKGYQPVITDPKCEMGFQLD